MATRSYIGIAAPDGSIKASYVHENGYPTIVGRILLDNYTKPEQVKRLVNLGAMSKIGRTTGDCVTIGGPEDREPLTLTDQADFSQEIDFNWTEFGYLFSQAGEWLIYHTPTGGFNLNGVGYKGPDKDYTGHWAPLQPVVKQEEQNEAQLQSNMEAKTRRIAKNKRIRASRHRQNQVRAIKTNRAS